MRDLLSDAYMARVEFYLEFEDTFHFHRHMLLHLRRELAGAARSSENSALVDFINPLLPEDPYVRRILQKPSPPFVIQAAESDDALLEAGDILVLKVLLFGNLGENVGRLAHLLQLLGKTGLFMSEGRFDLSMVVARDQAGNQQLLWRGGELPNLFTVPQINLLWHIEDRALQNVDPVLTFLTPARLLSQGKPLFSPAFIDIFPFILRRVTAMLYFWSGAELAGDPRYFLSLANEIEEVSNDLVWQDWRQMDGSSRQQELGGLLGALSLGQIDSEILLNILLLGELMHIGRGAAYGAGKYRLGRQE